MALSELLRYNAGVFDTLKNKCEAGTKFGKIANLLLFTLFRVVKLLKQGRHWNQKHVLRRIAAILPTRSKRSQVVANEPVAPWHFPLSPNALSLVFGRRILIVAELSIPQCKRYRVDQKAAGFRELGWQVDIASFTDQEACLKILPFAQLVIFYRTPYWVPVQRLVHECQRLGIPTVYDIDDLVFDPEEYRKHPLLQNMKPQERDSFLRGAEAYGRCLEACDHAIASTAALSDWMKKRNKGRIFIVENAFDSLSIQVKHFAENRPARNRPVVLIGYGSGTKSHDHDFHILAPTLVRIFQEFEQTRLVIHGYLNLGKEFEPYLSRVIHVPFLPAEAYLQSVADFDINLAPLEASVFNDAKSNIKFIEAALVGVPTIASPSRTFTESIEHGVNGFLAGSVDEWYGALRSLVQSQTLRQKVGQEAAKRAWSAYSPEATRGKLQKVLDGTLKVSTANAIKKPRVLSVNIFFRPFTFGGATVLLEHLMDEMRGDMQTAVFTCNQLPELAEYCVFKYEVDDTLVYSCKVEGLTLHKKEIFHPEMLSVFETVLQDYRPDIVHFHATQGMGVELLGAARKFGAKVVVTSHDAWWVCARQFMMKEDKTWCGQTQVDLRVCASCIQDAGTAFNRFQTLSRVLEDADLVLAPSLYHKQLLQKNLPKSVRIEVNKNGVCRNSVQRLRPVKDGQHPLRFAFLGGLEAEHKGYFLIKEAFEKLNISNYELLLVDLHQKLGKAPGLMPRWDIKGQLKLLEPFDQSEAERFYSGIDVILAPSKIPESFGMAVREALLYGCDVVTTRLGGIVEDLEGKPGVHFMKEINSDSLLEIVEKILAAQSSQREEGALPLDFPGPKEQTKELLGFYQSLGGNFRG